MSECKDLPCGKVYCVLVAVCYIVCMEVNAGLSSKEWSDIRKQVLLTGDAGFIGEEKWGQMNTMQRQTIHQFELAFASIEEMVG